MVFLPISGFVSNQDYILLFNKYLNWDHSVRSSIFIIAWLPCIKTIPINGFLTDFRVQESAGGRMDHIFNGTINMVLE